jgi:hypothetical protein
MYVREVEEEPEMKTQFTPEEIDSLDENEVFVFGSNKNGYHKAGAALTALNQFGAILGQGVGIQGNSYAIPTKGHKMEILPLSEIEDYVLAFLDFAEENPKVKFYVTKIGTGFSKYSVNDIAPLFYNNVIPPNVILPKEFHK